MKKIAVDKAKLRLDPRAPWSWAEGKVEIEAEATDAPVRVKGARALWGDDLIASIEKAIPGKKKYKHVETATPGEVGSVDVEVDESTLTSRFVAGGRKLATAGTRGRFFITAAAPSMLSSSPDPIGFHEGSWRIEDARQEMCLVGDETSGGATARGAPAVSAVSGEAEEEGNDGAGEEEASAPKFELIFVTKIDDGDLEGPKSHHRIVVDFNKNGSERIIHDRSQDYWGPTKHKGSIKIWGKEMKSVDEREQKFEILKEERSRRDEVEFTVKAAGKTALGKHMFEVIGEKLDLIHQTGEDMGLIHKVHQDVEKEFGPSPQENSEIRKAVPVWLKENSHIIFGDGAQEPVIPKETPERPICLAVYRLLSHWAQTAPARAALAWPVPLVAGVLILKIGLVGMGALGVAGKWLASFGKWVTPNIDFQFKVTLKRDGSGTIIAKHNSFPSYRIVLENKAACVQALIYEYKHMPNEPDFDLGPLDLRPMIALWDIDVLPQQCKQFLRQRGKPAPGWWKEERSFKVNIP